MVNDLLQWDLLFTDLLNLGKEWGMKEENNHTFFCFGGYKVFPFLWCVYRQDLPRLPHLV